MSRTTKVVLVVCVVLVFLLTACGGSTPAPTAGTVTNKAFHPEHTTTYQSCSGGGTKYSVRTCVPISTRHPDEWELRLLDTDGNEGWREVSHEEYDEAFIGGWYGPRDGSR